ncbi:hypothetical protein ACWEN3_41910 [Streptomyces sp. NPDC004561]
MFVVVTLLVALGIAVAQGCQGPARGLGGDGVRPQRQAPAEHRTVAVGAPVSERYEPTRSAGAGE